jgi:hypothetical protein
MRVIMARLTKILPLALLLVFSFRPTAAVTAVQGPIVTLDYGSFKGNLTGNLVKFLGIPFAAPPCVIPNCFGNGQSYPSIKYWESTIRPR